MFASADRRSGLSALAWGSAQQRWACRASQLLGLVAVLALLLYLAA